MDGNSDALLIVGLGNPGVQYSRNRHNVGFMIVEALAARVGGKFKAHKGGADVIEARLAGQRVILAKPRSFMNLSGGPVAAVSRFYQIPPVGVVVVHDELDLPYGTVRLKLGGGENGHNGLRSITKSLNTKDYHRVRFGIGRPTGRADTAEFVLRDFSSTESKELPYFVENAADAVESLIINGLSVAQNSFH